jgi:hypothetical protein
MAEGTLQAGEFLPSKVPLSFDNVRQQPPFRRGVFGGIASELKSRNPRILGVFSSTSNPSRGASFQKISVSADHGPRPAVTNSNRR